MQRSSWRNIPLHNLSSEWAGAVEEDFLQWCPTPPQKEITWEAKEKEEIGTVGIKEKWYWVKVAIKRDVGYAVKWDITKDVGYAVKWDITKVIVHNSLNNRSLQSNHHHHQVSSPHKQHSLHNNHHHQVNRPHNQHNLHYRHMKSHNRLGNQAAGRNCRFEDHQLKHHFLCFN